MCMQFTLDKNPSMIFLFTTLLLVVPCRKATNSAGPTVSSAQHVDQIRTLYESKPLVFKPCMVVVSACIYVYIYALHGLAYVN